MLRTQDLIKIALIIGIVSIGLFFVATEFATFYETDLSDADGLSGTLNHVDDLHSTVKDIEDKFQTSEGTIETAYYLIVGGVTAILKTILAAAKILITMVAEIIKEFNLGVIGMGIVALILTTIVFTVWTALSQRQL